MFYIFLLAAYGIAIKVNRLPNIPIVPFIMIQMPIIVPKISSKSSGRHSKVKSSFSFHADRQNSLIEKLAFESQLIMLSLMCHSKQTIYSISQS